MDIEAVAKMIVDSAITVHKALGSGLLESAYQKCLAYELRKRGLKVECEVDAPIVYDRQTFDVGYRMGASKRWGRQAIEIAATTTQSLPSQILADEGRLWVVVAATSSRPLLPSPNL